MALTTLDTEVAAHFFSHLAADYDVRPRLSQISCPTLVIVGREALYGLGVLRAGAVAAHQNGEPEQVALRGVRRDRHAAQNRA